MIRRELLALLLEALEDGPHSPAVLTARLALPAPGPSMRTVTRALGDLVALGSAQKLGHGSYARSGQSVTPNGQKVKPIRSIDHAKRSKGQRGEGGTDQLSDVSNEEEKAAAAPAAARSQTVKRSMSMSNGQTVTASVDPVAQALSDALLVLGDCSARLEEARTLEIARLQRENNALRARVAEIEGRVSPDKAPSPQGDRPSIVHRDVKPVNERDLKPANVSLEVTADEEIAIAERFAEAKDAGESIKKRHRIRELVVEDCRTKPGKLAGYLASAKRRREREASEAEERERLRLERERVEEERASTGSAFGFKPRPMLPSFEELARSSAARPNPEMSLMCPQGTGAKKA